MNTVNKINLKTLKRRASLIFKGSLSSIAPPFMNILFSLIVVKLAGTALWGGFVYYFLFASLASLVLNWGNKEYLLREFSKNPADISGLCRRSFVSRALLIIPTALVFLVFFPTYEAVFISVWIFLLFICQSFDVLVAYHRKFTLSLITEFTSNGLLFASIIIFRSKLDFSFLITLYLGSLLIKAAVYLIFFRSDVFKGVSVKADFSLLKKSLPFFMLGITGMLGSRIDQYAVSYFLPKETLGEYQVLKSFLLYFQTAAVLIILPFIKNIYRLPDISVDKLSSRLFLSGLVLIIPLMLFLFIMINFVYHFSFSAQAYIYSALFVLPVYYYSVIIYKMFKRHLQAVVVYINIIGIIISLILSVVLIPRLQLDGSLIAGAASGWVTAVIYFTVNRRMLRKESASTVG